MYSNYTKVVTKLDKNETNYFVTKNRAIKCSSAGM